MRCESCFGAKELMKSGGMRGFCEACSGLITCPVCQGMKQTMGNGGMTNTCKKCFGKGYINKGLYSEKAEQEVTRDPEPIKPPVKRVIRKSRNTGKRNIKKESIVSKEN